MTVKYICDGCGKESKGHFNGQDMFKPGSWFARNTDETVLHACCRECIEKINDKRGETTPIIPI